MRCQKCGHDNPPKAQVCTDCGNALVTPTVSIVAPGENAGFWMRFAAFGLDSFIVIPAYYLISYLYHLATLKPMEINYGWPFVYLLVYQGLFTGLKGQTIGKRLFNIKVIDVKSGKLGLARSFLRELLGKPITVLCIFIIVAGSLTVHSGRDYSLGWIHDKIARSKVIVTEQYKAMRTSAAWWLLEFLPVIGSILGLLILWRKDRRKGWAIFWGGLFMYSIISPPIIILVRFFSP